jgi:hypothetical protein
MYCPLLEDVLFTAACFGSVEPSSGNMHRILQKLLYLQKTYIFVNVFLKSPKNENTRK